MHNREWPATSKKSASENAEEEAANVVTSLEDVGL